MSSPHRSANGAPFGNIHVEASPEQTRPFAGNTAKGAPLAEGERNGSVDQLRAVYEDRVARYDLELASIITSDSDAAVSRYPQITLTLCGEETLVLDAELYQHL